MFGTLYNFKVTPIDYPGWPTNNRFFLQVIYGPAKILELLGIQALYANRLQALLLSSISFMLLLRKVQKSGSYVGLFLLLSFFSLPSMYLWTILGIREPFIFILIVLILHFLNLTRPLGNKGITTFVVLTIFLFLTKTYLYVYFIIAIWIGFLFAKLFKLKLFAFSRANFIPVIVLIPLLIFPSDSIAMLKLANLEIVKQTTRENTTITDGENTTITDGENTTITDGENTTITDGENTTITDGENTTMAQREFDRGQTLSEVVNQLSSNAVLSGLAIRLGLLEYIERVKNKSVSSVQDGSSGLIFPKGSISSPLSIIRSAIFFLVLPAPYTDNGSLIMNLLAYESVIWYLLYFTFLIFFVTRFRTHNLSCEQLQTFLFSFIFIVGSGLVETNLGTSLRHRSVLGLVLLSIIVKEKFSLGKVDKT
jgi:hypothetical protein